MLAHATSSVVVQGSGCPVMELVSESAFLAGSSTKLECLRRYEVADVHRRSSGNTPSRTFLQADIDFLHPHGQLPADAALVEAEVIKVCTATHVTSAAPGSIRSIQKDDFAPPSAMPLVPMYAPASLLHIQFGLNL